MTVLLCADLQDSCHFNTALYLLIITKKDFSILKPLLNVSSIKWKAVKELLVMPSPKIGRQSGAATFPLCKAIF